MPRVQKKKRQKAKKSLKDEYYQQINADLGAEFTLFAFEHPGWLAQHVPNGATLVFQTGDPGFDAWTRQLAEKNQNRGTLSGPWVLVHIRKMRPQRSRIVRADIEPFVASTAG